ncbi:hypothetical protein, partial [Paraburkholderia sp. SIMBA_053]|uniref:hypothetical protein n=1 Tax=Paraburkholderia sp. SIMBA_053 TaxID=3085794 RepID=UPI00397D33B5
GVFRAADLHVTASSGDQRSAPNISCAASVGFSPGVVQARRTLNQFTMGLIWRLEEARSRRIR